MNWIAAFLGIDPNLLQFITAVLGLIAAVATATTAVVGFLNRRIRLRAEAAATRSESTASSTADAVKALIEHLAEQRQDRDDLWAAYLAKDTIANPEGVRRIATETARQLTDAELLPIRKFAAAWELVEHRRVHRPETDVIRILQEELTA